MRGRELERVFFLFGVGLVGMQGRVFLIIVVVLKSQGRIEMELGDCMANQVFGLWV